MTGNGHHKDDFLARFEPPIAVDNQHIEKSEAAAGLRFDFLKRSFGHARIVLQRHRRYLLAKVQVAHRAEEDRRAANGVVALPQRGKFFCKVEGLFLHPDQAVRLLAFSPAA